MDAAGSAWPSHHRPDGGFRSPWGPAGEDRGAADLLRWVVQRRLAGGRPPRPDAPLSRRTPDLAREHDDPSAIRITWVGHATTLIQMGGLNVLTDPVWSPRVSPVRWLGPRRIERPGVPFDALPPIDAVLISHDHYDHLDVRSVHALHRRFGSRILWAAPLGHGAWLERRGIRRVAELDWGERVEIGPDDSGSDSRPRESILTAVALPAHHWTRRTPRGTNRRLWCGWSLEDPSGRRVYFAGDSGYCGAFSAIGARHGPFAASLLPIGAYEPRWFMRQAHMNPEEAVQVYRDLGGSGVFMGIHWGTFQLTDEPVDEPPRRVRQAWEDLGLPRRDLWIPAFGETRVVP